jgi:hypothetical protein
MDEPARTRRRDWAYVAVLALVLVSGLVYFGRGLDGAPRANGEPTSGETARLQSSETSDPASPQATSPAPAPTTEPSTPSVAPSPEATPESTPPAAPPVTCWDGSSAGERSSCTQPTGVQGLEWVFPSLDHVLASCNRARPGSQDDYAVSLSWVCFATAGGEPVTVTYDLVDDPGEVRTWMERRVGRAGVTTQGGRSMMRDVDQEPVRFTAVYDRFPYAVSVFAPTRAAAVAAWQSLVEMRPARSVTGA